MLEDTCYTGKSELIKADKLHLVAIIRKGKSP